MNFSRPGAEIYVPDGLSLPGAASRVTHLGIGAHQDDLEFMAYHGILACYGSPELWFGGVICTDGGGSARQGPYAGKTDAEIRDIRREEQRAAARLGRYGLMAQLDHTAAAVKTAAANPLAPDLRLLFSVVKPRFVYTHNPADKHESHLQVFAAVLEALRGLPRAERPQAIFGCEVWRGLDWVNDPEKVVHDVSGEPILASALNRLFDSQIAGGKRYDLATEGRRRANATYLTAHQVDAATHVSFALDLTPLIENDELDPLAFTLGFIERFHTDVATKLRQALR